MDVLVYLRLLWQPPQKNTVLLGMREHVVLHYGAVLGSNNLLLDQTLSHDRGGDMFTSCKV